MRALSIVVASLTMTVVACGGSSGTSGDGGADGGGSAGPVQGGNNGGRSIASGGKCSSSATTCAAATAYANCVMAKCDSQLKAAFGAGYASGNFAGGACASLMTCYMGCPCDATGTTCEQTCAAQMDATCTSAVFTYSSCAQTSGCTPATCSDAGISVPTSTATMTLTSTLTSTSTSTLTNTSTLTSTATLTSTSTSTGGPSCTAVTACCTTILGSANAGSCTEFALLTEAQCATQLSSWQQAGLCK